LRMRPAVAPVLTLFLFTIATALSTGCDQPAVVTVTLPTAVLDPEVPVWVTGGQVHGVLVDSKPEVISFKGVPYAAPPVGSLRWRPPEPVIGWDGVRDAAAVGSICMQGGGQSVAQSEDCLFLNIWAPRETEERLPVMVWIHGGGYTGGSGSTSLYDGTRFAERNVVLVTINYRLNVFGFLAHAALSAESPHDASGNYGLMDIVAALEWVRDNIETFGGDRDRVTIFGESAGAGAVMSVMLIPQSAGLFHGAIGQSNWVNGWDRQLRDSIGDWRSAEAQGDEFAKALGVTGGDILGGMRAASAEHVLDAANAGAGNFFLRTGYLWAPNVDGWTIPEDPLLMYEDGRQHNVPLITGMNGNEGSLMTRQMMMSDAEAFESHVRAIYPSVADQALAHYDERSHETAQAALDHLVHDLYFAGPVRTQATAHDKVTSPVWLYHFTRVPPTEWGSTLGSHHAAELPYVFGTMSPRGASPVEAPLSLTTEGAWTEIDRQLSETMMAYWTQFVATGNPNRDDLPAWPEFDGLTDQYLEFGETVVSGTGLHNAGAELFRAFEERRRAGT